MSWGKYGGSGPCEHLIELRNTLARLRLAVWSEHGEDPAGWVNVNCEACGRTYETTLHLRREPLEPLKVKP